MGIVTELVKKARMYQCFKHDFNLKRLAAIKACDAVMAKHSLDCMTFAELKRDAFMEAAKMVKADLIMREEVLR